MVVDIIQRERDLRRGIRLEYVTVGWNILERAIANLNGCGSAASARVRGDWWTLQLHRAHAVFAVRA